MAADREGELLVVATPIGNLGDVSPRASDALRTCDRVLAEDTRHTRALLAHLGITGKSIDAIHAHSPRRDIDAALSRLAEGQRLCLVTDAGTPIVSDPGRELVQAAALSGVRVTPIPGPSAVLAALVGSGLADDAGFWFLGFLPRDGASRRHALERIAAFEGVVVVFESPNRTAATLTDLAEGTPGRAACVARELTKVHEEFVRGPLSELSVSDRQWRGEIVVVLGAHAPQDRSEVVTDAMLDARIEELLAAGVHAKTIAERLAAWSGRPRRDLYARDLARKP
jgi:16S rRNA (cytidine1402-2'-O)-methyltransferase